MRDQILRSRSFSRRALVLTGGKLFLMSTLLARLYYLQITQAEKYKTLSDGNRIRLVPILPKRGKLLDRYGNALAENENHYKVWFDPTQSDDPTLVFDKLATLMEIEQERHVALFNKLADSPEQPLLIGQHVDWKYVSSIEVNNTELPGVEVHSAQVRYYPLGTHAAHALGFVGLPGKGEVEKSPLLGNEDYKVGKSGVEKVLESKLKGDIGMRHIEVNAYGLGVRELEVKDSNPGENVALSIDHDLQEYTSKLISDKGGKEDSGGAVVVMDVENGEIITLASTPSFDPNVFVQGISQDYWKTLNSNSDKPLINKTIANQYAPGSTFKIIVALAALEKGVINTTTRHYCPGYMDYGDRRFHCWNDRGHGQMNLKSAISESCNVFFYKISQDVGIEAIASMARRFGLGAPTEVELHNELAGLVPDKQWKRQQYGKDWYIGETIVSSIGQGYLLATPIQLAKMVAQVANGGKKIKPTMFKQPTNIIGEKDIQQPESEENKIQVNANHLRLIQQGMIKVVNSSHGTAYQSRIIDKKFAMAGKTGTVQVRHRVEDENEFIPRKYKNHALFVGYAPIDKPKYAISVIIEHGGSGAFTAAPIAKDVLLKAQELLKEKGNT